MPIVAAVGVAVGHGVSGDAALAERLQAATTAALAYAFTRGVAVADTDTLRVIQQAVMREVRAGRDLSSPEALAALVDANRG